MVINTEEEPLNNRDVVLQIGAENAMEATYQQRGSVKEMKTKITLRYRLCKRQMILWGHKIKKDG